MTPNEYRRKHKRCGTCRYWNNDIYTSNFVGMCLVKRIRKNNTNGKFCKVYKMKEFKE